MASNLKIRPLRAADEAAWQQLFSDYATFYQAKIPADAVEAAFHGMLSADLTLRGWVAVINDKPVGLAHLVLHPSTWSLLPDAYLNDLFVDPTYRRHGVGRALLQEVVNTGHEEGWRKLYWKTAGDNEAAQGLYRKVAAQTDWMTFEVKY